MSFSTDAPSALALPTADPAYVVTPHSIVLRVAKRGILIGRMQSWPRIQHDHAITMEVKIPVHVLLIALYFQQ